MAGKDDNRPIIIKKVKKGGGHGHHGGAWKVAYADFVTAMMAFFLLLWLLSSASEEQLEGLAEFFTPTIGIKDSVGIGVEGGIASIEDGNQKNELTAPGVVIGQVPQGPIPDVPEKQAQKEGMEDAYLFEKAEEAMKRAFESDPNLRDLSDNVIVEQTPEGMKIDIVDSDKNPMFDPGRASITQFGRRVLEGMLDIIEKMPNFISISGHTDATPLSRGGRNYGNWELSADRANAARRYLLSKGMDPERTKKVQGMAATDLLFPDEPSSAKNRRITIILLRGSRMELREEYLPATRDLLSVPGVGPSRMAPVRQEPQEEIPAAPTRQIAPDTQTMGLDDTPLQDQEPKPTEPALTPEEEKPGLSSDALGTGAMEPVEAKPAELTDEELQEFMQ